VQCIPIEYRCLSRFSYSCFGTFVGLESSQHYFFFSLFLHEYGTFTPMFFMGAPEFFNEAVFSPSSIFHAGFDVRTEH